MGDTNITFGAVHGPVQTGDGVQLTAGRDIHLGGSREVLDEVAQLRTALAGLSLTQAQRRRADTELTGMEHAISGSHPDAAAVGGHLESFVAGLKKAGALASASTSLLASISSIARWLGPLGVAALALL